MKAFNITSKIVKWIIPLILTLVYCFYWDTKHNLEGLWIYCGWLTLLFWQSFAGHVDHVKRWNNLNARIEHLEEKLKAAGLAKDYHGEGEKPVR